MGAALTALVVLVLDQVTKDWVRQAFALHEYRPVLGRFLGLTYVRNTGAAWGILHGANAWLAVISLITLIVLSVFHRRWWLDLPLHRIGLGMLCGGIAGNLVDRVRLGYVTDFISLHFGSYEFPAFNVADMAITLSVAFYLWVSLGTEARASSERGVEGPAADGH
jgi:signal peptidase II